MRLLVILILTSLCWVAFAEADRTDAARRLVDTLQIDTLYDKARLTCLEESKDTGIDVLFKAHPKEFGSLKPGVDGWPEVEALYRRYRIQACQSPPSQEIKDIYVRAFARHLSADDLDAAARMAATPTGRAMQAASNEASHIVMTYARDAQEKISNDAGLRFKEELSKLVARHQGAQR